MKINLYSSRTLLIFPLIISIGWVVAFTLTFGAFKMQLKEKQDAVINLRAKSLSSDLSAALSLPDVFRVYSLLDSFDGVGEVADVRLLLPDNFKGFSHRKIESLKSRSCANDESYRSWSLVSPIDKNTELGCLELKVGAPAGIFASTNWLIVNLAMIFLEFILIFLIIRRLRLDLNAIPFLLANNKGFDSIKFHELNRFAREFISKVEEVEKSKIEIAKRVASENLANLATQVSHDIRSPLSALNLVVSSLQNIPEEKRLMLRTVAQRINDIANQLLKQGKQISQVQPDDSVVTPRAVMLVSVIDSIVSEKRVQARGRMGVSIESNLSNAYGLFVAIEASELSRIISNLINNSLEAIGDFGVIAVSLIPHPSSVTVVVSDNGQGIAPEIKDKLGERGVTYGKAGSSSGTGLGIFHAKTTIEQCGGKFRIESTQGSGTKVFLDIPRISPPWWFVESINLKQGMKVISIDDDQTIHQIWSGRLQQAVRSLKIDHLMFTAVDSFETWLRTADTVDCIFLVDYELIGQSKNGLDIIEEMKIAERSILVTSRYDENRILIRARHLNVRILPKGLAPFIPIQV